MAEYRLHREQTIAAPIDDVFAFFSDAQNLERITPPWLGFRVVTPGPIMMRVGARIRYRLRLHGLPVTWESEIVEWNPPRGFVDVQLRGPYRRWHHRHTFEPAGDETWMSDTVDYALPLGPLGTLAHALLVRRDVETIFRYRRAVIDEIFAVGAQPATSRPAHRGARGPAPAPP